MKPVKVCKVCMRVYVGHMWLKMGIPEKSEVIPTTCPECSFDNLDELHSAAVDNIIQHDNLFARSKE